MATVTEATEASVSEEAPYSITSDVYVQMVEQGLIPTERRVFLWGGRLFEKMAKTKAHAAVHCAFIGAIARRLPAGMFVGDENPVRLDDTHVPLPDVIVARGAPLDYYDTRYPDGRDVLLVVEVAVSSLPEDPGPRLARYARSLPMATYIVADIPHRQALVHTRPQVTDDPSPGRYGDRLAVRADEAIRLRLEGTDLEPIPFDEVMR